MSVNISIESLATKDSLELTDEDHEILKEKVAKEKCERIIVTHGTDTIPLSAQCLKHITEKTIIFTGAMLPAKFFDSDAPFNLGGAVIASQILPSGMYLIMHGRIFDPLVVIKDREKSLFI